jgi:hypothetical protein
MGSLPPELEDEFRRDIRFAEEAINSEVVPSRSATSRKDWAFWTTFCVSLHHDSLLVHVADKVKFLQVFAHRVYIGTLARNAGNKPVRSRTVEDYLRSVSQGFTSVGALDSRHQVGTILNDFRLYRQLRCYSKQDPPPSRVKPLPFGVLHNVRQMAALHGDPISPT